MRFNRLRLTGFKSFVDPTDLHIGDGLTGVVGPNGCGKSNLLEALRWVMGETRPTAMRGDGMEDVIFAGAASRPARSFAEVALHLDNSERRAPQGFNDSDMLEIVRRITRDAGSAYRANGRDVRARDVQMLFADASTGAHSPALVRQGQIAELINAKPTARRRILEEAAGISGLYQRRHEAELKLRGAETNLTRVDDVIEQLAAQLAALARQARAAARYREIAEALRQAEGVLLWRRWRDAEDARTTAEAELANAVAAAASSEREARRTAAAHEEAEAVLPPLREEAAIAAAVLQRLAVERDALKGRAEAAEAEILAVSGRREHIQRDIEREESLTGDADRTLEQLEVEGHALAADEDGHAERLSEAAQAAEDAHAALREREGHLAHLTETMAVLVARRQSAERALADAEAGEAAELAEIDRADRSRAAAEDALAAAETACAEAERRRDDARAASSAAEAELSRIDAQRSAAQEDDSRSGAEHAAASREARALEAEVSALQRLLAQSRGPGDRVLDQVTVRPGYEAAFGAALGDDAKSPLAGDAADGWADVGGAESPNLPGDALRLADVVDGPPALARRLARTGVVEAADGARLQALLGPGMRLVSRDGDLWRWDGFRRSAANGSSEATLRLQQGNRLKALQADHAVAVETVATASAAHEAAAGRLAELTRAERAQREARRAADEAAGKADRSLSRAVTERETARQRLHGARQAAERHRNAAKAAAERVAEARAALGQLGDVGAARAALDDAKHEVDAVRLTMLTRRSTHDELRRAGEARVARRAAIEQERKTWSARRETADERLADLSRRRDEAEAELQRAQAAPGEIAEALERLSQSLAEAEARRRAADDALAQAETAERAAAREARDAERAAGSAREARAAATARSEAALETARAAALRIAEEAETDPDALAERLGEAIETSGPLPEIEARIARLRHSRDSMGAVNLRAEEDAAEVRAEHEALTAEKADLEEAIRALRQGIASLNREGRERLLTAFEQVNENFGTLFTHLFGGGEARLEMVESDDPLEAGLEILCQPPGKKLATLSLLSGGEQTLTALALIFAVFLANPAPICVLDEVDAPLDDANVTRFCDLLDEMTRRTDTRFLIITHHAVTMSRMDRLFGVTMAEQGVSQLVSVDLRAAEALAA